MRRRLPPIGCLCAFETVAELGSFSKAGTVLALTHSAISHQVKQLEERLGVKLLDRQARGVAVTEEGRLYLDGVRRALKELEDAERSLRRFRSGRPVRVSVLPSFAGNVLLPLLHAFLEAHPELQIEIDTTAEVRDSSSVDVFIRYGPGDWAGYESIRLLGVTLMAVCSPAYLQRRGPFRDLRDLSRAVLLRHVQEPWDAWFTAAAHRYPGHDASIIPAGPLYNDARLMLDAACEGQGIALARSALAAGDLRQGRLVPILDIEVESPSAYFAHYRAADRHTPGLALFIEWLRKTFPSPEAAASEIREVAHAR